MKLREPRCKVLIPARMRSGAVWSSIVIHNISSRGLMAETADPPEPGTYVEVRRATQTIIGRTAWRNARSFGMMTQDRIDIDAILQEPGFPETQRLASSDAAAPADRQRAIADVAHRAERSRQFSSILQYIAFGVVSLVAAGFAATEVYTLLAQPLHQVSSHLSNTD